MFRNFKKEIFSLLVFLLLPFMFAFTDVQLNDIETAVLEQDYKKANQLAQDYITGHYSPTGIPQARYYLGLSYLYLENYRPARDAFSQIIHNRADPQWETKAYIGLVDSYILEDNYPEALKIAEQLLKMGPQPEFQSVVYLKLARIHLRLTNWQEARIYLEKIINNYPASLEYHIAKQLLEEKQFFSVQVGAFLDQSRAENLTGELQAKGDYAYIVETVDREENRFYRVRVGQLSTLTEAKNLKRKLANLGYPTRIFP
jgi:TolA-binding protein